MTDDYHISTSGISEAVGVSKAVVLGVPVSRSSPAGISTLVESGPALVTFVNPAACTLGRDNPEYLVWLSEFDWVLCDGSGMAWAARRAGLTEVRRCSFDMTSLARPVFEWAAEKDARVGLVGGAPGVARAAMETLRAAFPSVKWEPPFSGFGTEVMTALDHHVRAGTDLVICGMGAPLQERFLLDLREQGWSGLGFTCGGFLDQAAQRLQYYPSWIDRYNLRFMFRLCKEPARLWRRYLIDYQEFLFRASGLRKTPPIVLPTDKEAGF